MAGRASNAGKDFIQRQQCVQMHKKLLPSKISTCRLHVCQFCRGDIVQQEVCNQQLIDIFALSELLVELHHVLQG